MAYNPKLNVYILRLKPVNDSVQTFRDLFKAKFCMDALKSDDDVFEEYFKRFVNEIGNDKFRKDNKNKKVLGVANDSILPIFPHENTYIDGVIEGGKFGILREYADTDKKEDKTIIGANNAVLDKYYILLYTPLNSEYGFLLVQSYTEESVQDSLRDFIRVFFSCDNTFYNAVIEPFVPEKLQEKYMNNASVRMFSFSTKTGVSQILRNDIQIQGQTFEVEIKVKPIDSTLKPDTEETNRIYEELTEKSFDGVKLRDCRNKKIYVKDTNDRNTHYDIEKEIKNIKPTIYLEDEGITIDDKTGLPDFSKIKEFCIKVLKEVLEEFDKKSNINEY